MTSDLRVHVRARRLEQHDKVLQLRAEDMAREREETITMPSQDPRM